MLRILIAAFAFAISPVVHHPTARPHSARHHSVTAMQTGIASWYEDEGATACGMHATLGVANLSLPCGTRLRICHAGCETATVDDRGPYVKGRVLDLDAAAKAAIGCSDLCSVAYRVAGG
jgi:rare lipoprotein A